jgi:hypothetical protein
MKETLKEFAKHYLGIAAAIMIAMLVGIFFTEPRLSIERVIFGFSVYILFLAIALIFFRWSRELKKDE